VWARGVGAVWAERHRAAQQAHAEIQQLTEKAQREPLSRDEAWRRVRLVAEFDTMEDAIPLLRETLDRWPDSAPGRFMLGQCLLKQGDETGVPLLEEAMAQDQDLVVSSCRVIHEFLSAKGRNEEAAAYLKRGMERYAVIEAAEHERQTFTKRDVFLPHDLSDDVLESVRVTMSAHPEIVEAYVVRKQLRTETRRPSYVLGVVPKFKGLIVDYDKASKALLQRMLEPGDLSVPMTVIIMTGAYAFLAKRMRKVPGALVYRKDK
jgi:tetratricopeptide (TPR) repeat protein